MATKAHCIYCFETLSARLEKRTALTLSEVESLWSECMSQDEQNSERTGGETPEDSEQVCAEDEDEEGEAEEEQEEEEELKNRHYLRPRQVSNIRYSTPTASSSSSTPSNSSCQTLTSEGSKASSKSSLSSNLMTSFKRKDEEEEYPLFVTWNTIDTRRDKSLRGCIGTFESQRLSQGLKEYALTSAFNDVRFSPISISELPNLSCDITLLLNFTQCQDPLDWELGMHGVRISFTYHHRRYGSTYLPQVAPEQGWTKEETIISLMRKAGWSGRTNDWRKVTDMKCTRYEGKKADIDYHTFQLWREWVDKTKQDRLGMRG